jgi:hypothetical protein
MTDLSHSCWLPSFFFASRRLNLALSRMIVMVPRRGKIPKEVLFSNFGAILRIQYFFGSA